MEILHAIFLGVLQGLTEFLPVSSSGHLAIGQKLLGFDSPDMFFSVLLHVATLLVVLLFFKKRVGQIIKAFLGIFFKKFSKDYFEHKRFLWGIIVASIPTAIIGLTIQKYVIQHFDSILYVGYALIVTSFILIISDKFHGRQKVSLPTSLVIGISQGIAVIPGISRSGATIATSVMLGIDREEAAEFSFLLSVPAILGAMLLQCYELYKQSLTTNIYDTILPKIFPYGIGMISAFISGFIVIGLMLLFVKNAKLKYFAIYCLILGVLTVIFS